MKSLAFVLIILLASCATPSLKHVPAPPKAPSPVTNQELWVGRSGDELLLHPIYASLPLESRSTSTGIEVKSFKNSGGTVSNQSCSISNYYSNGSANGSGSCSDSRYEISCNHIFYVKKNKITDYKKVGQCFGDRFDFRPHDQNGEPVVTDSEKRYIKELVAYNQSFGPSSCNLTADCSDGMSCKDNKCQSLGLMGRLLNP